MERSGSGEQARRATRRSGLRDRRFAISAAAVRLFGEKGLEDTTVDDIAAAAGVAPRTFFRHFATKEEAAFPDHDEKIADLRAKLAERHPAINPLAVVLEAARSSALQYLSDPDLYRPRFHLVHENPALRDRERLIDYLYEVTMAEYLEAELGEGPAATMQARALAAGILAAVNCALYAWAEAPDDRAAEVLEEGLDLVEKTFAPLIGSEMKLDADRITLTLPASAEIQDALVRALGANGVEVTKGSSSRRGA